MLLNLVVSGESFLDYNYSECSFLKLLKNCFGYYCWLLFIIMFEFFIDWYFEWEVGCFLWEVKINWGGKVIL